MSDLVGEVVASAINHPDATWPAEQMADHELSLELLAGYRGFDREVRFLEAGSPRERELRAALAREIRRHMSGFVGELLALAIDPNAQPKMATTRRTRNVVFESATPGKPSTWARDLMMVDFLKKALREPVTDHTGAEHNLKLTAAYKLAADDFGCSERTVRDVWKAYWDGLQSPAVKKTD
jgi:hypothetical protein